MGRPRKYASEEEKQRAHAESQRAYRQRQTAETLPVDRAALGELVAAVETAAAAGDPLARRISPATPDTLLRNLARVFRERAAAAHREPPT